MRIATITVGAAQSLTASTLAVPVASAPIMMFTDGGPERVTVQANFVYGSGGTTVDAYLQTSLDGGLNWTDIDEFHFTTASLRTISNHSSLTPVAQFTPTDGTMTVSTTKDGVIGNAFRVKWGSTGTYAGTTLNIDIVPNGGLTVKPKAVSSGL